MAFLRHLSSPFSNWDATSSSTRRRSSTPLLDLPSTTKDTIFLWQLGQEDFCRIDETTLLRSSVVDTNLYASRLLAGCLKAGVIDIETGQPVTAKVGRDLGKYVPLMSVPKQKELVMLLFFWEEEIVRWNLLCVEEIEVKGKLAEAQRLGVEGERVDLQEELKFVQAKKRIRPSLRDQSGRVREGVSGEDVLPTYEEARRERYR